jgi:hypothetical protein
MRNFPYIYIHIQTTDNVIYFSVTKKRNKCLGQLPSTKYIFSPVCSEKLVFFVKKNNNNNKKNETASGPLLNTTTGEMNCWRLALFVFFLWQCVHSFLCHILYKLTGSEHDPQTSNRWLLNFNRHERSIYSIQITHLTYTFVPLLLETILSSTFHIQQIL